MNISFTPEVLAGIVGVLLALLFAYFPKLRTWFGALASEKKSAVMISLLLIAAVVITILVHYGALATPEPITWLSFAKILFVALVANQPTYQILPVAQDVKAVKLMRDGVG